MAIQLKEHLSFSPYFVDTDKSPGFNWERYQDKIDKLSDNLFGVLVDNLTSEFIKSLTQKYIQLSVQGPDIARLIRDVVIADVFLGDMPQEVQKRLGLDPATAREVANQIVREVFTPVLEELKQVHRTRFPNRVSGQPAPSRTEGSASGFSVDSGQKGQPQSQQRPTIPPSARPAQSPHTYHYQGEELPESGGNIINLRGMSND